MNKTIDEQTDLKDNSFHFYIKRSGWPITPHVGYCPGVKLFCPKCNFERICIFFKPGFIGKEQNMWCDLIDKENFVLCNNYEIIKKSNYNPNWICKNCYDGGVILKK